MFNSLDVYKEVGERAAKAMNQKDLSLYEREKRWLSTALSMEADAYRIEARAAYDQGFKDVRNVPQITYFR